MAFDFPNNPVIGDEYSSGGATYTWDGITWDRKAGDQGYVKVVGDTMLGPLVLPTPPPAAPLEATHKEYVDAAVASASLYQGPWQVAANLPDLTPTVALPMNTYSWIAQTVDADVGEVAPAALPGIGGLTIFSGDNIIWNEANQVYDHLKTVSAVSQGAYVPLIGGTMTGVLTIEGVTNPTFVLNNVGNVNNRIEGRKSGLPRWSLDLGSAVAENTSNAGSDFVIYRYVNDGSTWTRAMQINRTDGFMSLTSGIGFGNVAHAAGSMDLSKHISLYGGAAGTFGFNVTGSKLNYHVSQNSVHEFWVNGVSKLSVQTTTSYLNTNLNATGTIYSTGGQNTTGFKLNDGGRIDFSSSCLISKVYGANQFQFHTANTQVFTFHISGHGDAYVIDKVGSAGNSFSATAPEALALGAELGVERRKPETEGAAEGVDIVKMLAACFAKIKSLELDIATLKEAR